jgi:hypothetical protein
MMISSPSPQGRSQGFPIGDLNSQSFANHYLSGLDHFAKEELRCRAYVRHITRIKELDEKHETGQWDEAACQCRAQALISFTRHADSVRFRKNVLKRFEGRTVC